jgi:hypothetical protein
MPAPRARPVRVSPAVEDPRADAAVAIQRVADLHRRVVDREPGGDGVVPVGVPGDAVPRQHRRRQPHALSPRPRRRAAGQVRTLGVHDPQQAQQLPLHLGGAVDVAVEPADAQPGGPRQRSARRDGCTEVPGDRLGQSRQLHWGEHPGRARGEEQVF